MFYVSRMSDDLLVLYPRRLGKVQPFAILFSISSGRMVRVSLADRSKRGR
jgi:hypothetical protein